MSNNKPNAVAEKQHDLQNYYMFQIPYSEDSDAKAIASAEKVLRTNELGRNIGGAMLMKLSNDWYAAYSPVEVPDLSDMRTLTAQELYAMPDDDGTTRLQEWRFHEGAPFKVLWMPDDTFAKCPIDY